MNELKTDLIYCLEQLIEASNKQDKWVTAGIAEDTLEKLRALS